MLLCWLRRNNLGVEMGYGLKSGALALAGVLLAAPAMAASSSKCAKANEVTAIQVSAIQQELMVAALTCDQVANFNAFQTGFSKELRASDAVLEKMFKRVFGGRVGEDHYHAFKTRLANSSSIRSIHDNPGYCHEAAEAFSAALTSSRPTLAAFASSVTVHDDSPVDSCDVRVAVNLKNAGAVLNGPAVLPKPKPEL
jgi:hypothetical protein